MEFHFVWMPESLIISKDGTEEEQMWELIEIHRRKLHNSKRVLMSNQSVIKQQQRKTRQRRPQEDTVHSSNKDAMCYHPQLYSLY